MGWRDFQAAPPQEFMESMELMTIETPLIPLIPLIPVEAAPKIGVGIPVSATLPERELLTSIKPFWASWEIMGVTIPADHLLLTDAGTSAADSKPNLYCESGGCHCSQKLPAANYPNGCGRCEYYGEPPATTEPEAPRAFRAPAPISTHAPTHCTAEKVGGRVCGAPLREGLNGHLSCTAPVCQVPATRHGLMRRTGHKTLNPA